MSHTRTSSDSHSSDSDAQGPMQWVKFEYSPLAPDDIRLVQLHSYNHELGVVECAMVQEPLGESDFLALSYTWGDPTDLEIILVDRRQLGVTRNLKGFLRMFAGDYPEASNSKLWIDAICINQDDLVERSTQVLRMASIYSTAQEVLVWLGEQTDQANLGYTQMLKYCEHLKGSKDPRQNDVCRDILKSLASMSQYGQMEFILSSPWWQRFWVLQEFVLAQRVRFLCGSVSMAYYSVRKVSEGLLWVLPPLTPENVKWSSEWANVRALLALRQVEDLRLDRSKAKVKANLTLLALLIKFNDRCCHDPRDRVYSLLGYCSDIMPGDIVPDYHKTVRDVYMDAVQAYLLRNENLDILSGRDLADDDEFPPTDDTESSSSLPDDHGTSVLSEDSNSWPGWLPRFGSGFVFASKLPFQSITRWNYNASRLFSLSSYPWGIDPSAGALNLFGAVVDVVTQIAPTEPDEMKQHTYEHRNLQRLREYMQLAEELPPVYALTGESTKKVLSTVVLAPYLRYKEQLVDDIFDTATNPNTTSESNPDMLKWTSTSQRLHKGN